MTLHTLDHDLKCQMKFLLPLSCMRKILSSDEKIVLLNKKEQMIDTTRKDISIKQQVKAVKLHENDHNIILLYVSDFLASL